MEIRNANTADIPLIIELAMQVWPQTYTPIVGGEQVSYMLSKFYDPLALRGQMEEYGQQFIIGYDQGTPVAFASYSLIEPHIYKLQKLYIAGGQQGKGIGKTMVYHIVGRLKALQATSLRLNVNRFNANAIAFYSKLGFSRYAEEDIDIGSGYYMNDYVLSLALMPL